MNVKDLVSHIKSHACYTHPLFKNWAAINPSHEVVGALFHQIRSFCDATRPAHAFLTGLTKHGLAKECILVCDIAESEEDHGPQLATMAGHIINKMTDNKTFTDVYDQASVENHLKHNSNAILGALPGYDKETGLLIQNKIARNVFEGRKKTDKDTVMKNLGTTLALEIISNRHLIPGEKLCLVDANLYDVSMDDSEMYYLAEHWGEAGAEAMHEQSAVDAISTVINEENAKLMFAGANEFLDALLALWETLNSALLGSGYLNKAS